MALVDTRAVIAVAIPSVMILSAFIVGLPVATSIYHGAEHGLPRQLQQQCTFFVIIFSVQSLDIRP
jgi:hypothetical protein